VCSSDLPAAVRGFELSPDGRELLARCESGLKLLHVPTGIGRRLAGRGEPFAWLGDSGRAVTESRSWVRVRVDPTPSKARDFLPWIASLTDVEPGEVLVPAAALESPSAAR
jgi:hypothetical protein